MSCDITRGRLEQCKNSVGGLKAVYFVNFGTMGAVTYDMTDTDVITAVAGTPDAFKYDLKGESTYEETITSDRNAGTTFFTQALTLNLKKLTKKDHKELKLLAWGRLVVLVEDNNGNVFVAGLTRGMDVTGGTITTGAALGDMSGYTLTLEGQEPTPANWLASTAVTAGFDVVVGT
jgi:hypothetical protein